MTINDISTALERTVDWLLGVYKDRPATTENILLLELGKKYGIEIVTDHAAETHHVSYRRPSQAQIRIVANLLAKELAVYPVEIIKLSRLERLIICNTLRSHNREVAGLAEMGLFVIDTIYLSADSISEDREYGRRTFHHELFHAIDFHDDLLKYLDPEWHRLNSAGYIASHDHHIAFNQPTDTIGFLSTHSMTAIYEDKAEVYAHLMINYQEVEDRAGEDEVLARKVVRMKELLHRFSPAFNEDFWSEARRRSAYLQRRDYSSTADLLADLESRSPVTTGKTVRIALKETTSQSSFKLARVWDDLEGGRRIWRLALCNSPEDASTSEETFKTFNKLCVRLQKLGARTLPRKDDVQGGTVHVEIGG